MLQAQNLTVLKTVQKPAGCYGQAVMKIGFGLVYQQLAPKRQLA
jgi:hypothetical protein